MSTDNSLRSLLHHFLSHIPKSIASFSSKGLLSRVHLQIVRSEVGCIHLMLPPVCLSPRYVKASLIWSISYAGMKLRMFLVYTEPSTMRIGEAGFEQLANIVSFRVADTIFPRKNVFFCQGRCCSKRYLWRKIDRSLLYFSPNSLLTLHRINILKKAKHRLLTCRHPGMWRVVASNLRSPEFGCITYAEGDIWCFETLKQ